MKKTVIFICLVLLSFNILLAENKTLSPVIDSTTGQIQGFYEDNIWKFYGIPYAQPPIDELRWVAPQPKSWEDVLVADKFGPECPQIFVSIFKRQEGVEDKEDCLYLNVWTKDLDGKKPVIFWIHGGGFEIGAGSWPKYDGSSLALKNAVVVTFNYRLGPFGFLAHPLLSEEAPYGTSGNYGLLDQIAALKWVNENIEKFGGDPENITVMGQSAGGISIASMMVSPFAEGLFNQAIIMSGLIPFDLYPLKSDNKTSMEDIGVEFQKVLGIEDGDILEQMRDLDTFTIFEKFETIKEQGLVRKHLCYDGYYFPEDPYQLFQEEKFQKVPTIVGGTQNEGSLFKLLFSMSKSEYYAYLDDSFEDDYDLAMKYYGNWLNYENAYSRIIGDFFMMNAEMLANYQAENGSDVYRYNFKWYPLPFVLLDLKAYHSLDVPYALGNLSGILYTDYDYEISDMLQDYIIQFIYGEDELKSNGIIWDKYSEYNTVLNIGWTIRNKKQPRQKYINLIFDNLYELLENEAAY